MLLDNKLGLNDRIPSQDQLSKIADAFDVNPSWLMGYDVPISATSHKIDIGAKIKHFRIKNNMEQKELAKLLNVSPKTISSWEVNRTQPKAEMFKAMSIIFDCSISDFVSDSPHQVLNDLSSLYSLIIRLANNYSANEINIAIKMLETLRDSK